MHLHRHSTISYHTIPYHTIPAATPGLSPLLEPASILHPPSSARRQYSAGLLLPHPYSTTVCISLLFAFSCPGTRTREVYSCSFYHVRVRNEPVQRSQKLLLQLNDAKMGTSAPHKSRHAPVAMRVKPSHHNADTRRAANSGYNIEDALPPSSIQRHHRG